MKASVRMRSFAKINLGLEVVDRRPDGYHQILTIYQAIDLHDEIEFSDSRDQIRIVCSDPDIPTDERNLVWRAASLLAEAFHLRRGVTARLQKNVPQGSGLGGGSSNAAATLLALNELWGLGLKLNQLLPFARRLGADVPFFLYGGTAFGSGIGDRIDPMPDIPDCWIVVVYPGVAVSTQEAYELFSPLVLTKEGAGTRMQALRKRLENGDEGWMDALWNDFESVILAKHPEVKSAKELLRLCGARSALMTGSGSAVFGLFEQEQTARRALGKILTPGWRQFLARPLSAARYRKLLFS